MLSKLRSRLTYANVMATIAVFLALGGSAYAVAANSVGTAQLKNGAVTNPKLASNAVGTGKVLDGSLLAKDLAQGVLPARAYAHVLANGTLDRPNTNNVVDIRPDCESQPCPAHEGAAAQCFKLTFAPHSASGVVSTFGSYAMAVKIPAPSPGLVLHCPSGYRSAETFTYETANGGGAQVSFYVVFY